MQTLLRLLTETDVLVENAVKAKRVMVTVGVLMMVVVMRVRRGVGGETHKMLEDIGRFMLVGQKVRVVGAKSMSQRERI